MQSINNEIVCININFINNENNNNEITIIYNKEIKDFHLKLIIIYIFLNCLVQ